MLTSSVTCNLQNSCYFRCPVWKLIKLITANLHKKLKHANSILFWIFLPNVIKIDPYNFELYRFKIYACFGTQYRLRDARTLLPSDRSTQRTLERRHRLPCENSFCMTPARNRPIHSTLQHRLQSRLWPLSVAFNFKSLARELYFNVYTTFQLSNSIVLEYLIHRITDFLFI